VDWFAAMTGGSAAYAAASLYGLAGAPH